MPVLTVPDFFTVTGFAEETCLVAGFLAAVLALPNWGSLKAIVTDEVADVSDARWRQLQQASRERTMLYSIRDVLPEGLVDPPHNPGSRLTHDLCATTRL